jgi:hypothetical protein
MCVTDVPSTRVVNRMTETLKGLSLDISQSLIFCIVFVAMAVLVALGKIESDKLQWLLLILVPSPVTKKTEVVQ